MPQSGQSDLFVQINASFADDDMQIISFTGRERLSSLFEYDLVFTSKSDSLDLEKSLKNSINVHIKTAEHERYFDGIIAEFSQGAVKRKDEEYRTEYFIKIRPKLWLLTLDQNYLMFQEKSALDIIKAVLKDCGVKDVSDKVRSCGKTKREYCVQYEESSFNFVSRLMEEEGIFYFFEHTSSKHTMVLADNSSAYVGNSKVKFAHQIDETFPLGNVFDIQRRAAVTTGASAVADYNYKISQTKLYKKLDSQWKDLPFYEYPGKFSAMSGGENISKLRVEEFEFGHSSVTASSSVPEFSPGSAFTLQGHHSDKFNADYTLYAVEHEIIMQQSLGAYVYKNKFRAFSKKVEFRPPRITPKPRIFGLQSAVVVCPSNQEIYRDKFGCIKVHFHWDQTGKAKDTNDSSCWIRVAQTIAGNGWGGLFIPRVGQEVLVAFSEGDPDRPIVVAGAYNDKHLPAYSDKEAMNSSLKTVTYKDNEKGFNEIRFYDEKDKEEFYEHAQKDMVIEIENSRSTHIKESDDTLLITKGNSHTTLESADKPVKHTLLIKEGDKSVQIDKGNETYLLKNGNETLTLEKGDYSVTLNSGNVKIKVTGDITIDATGNISVSAQKNISLDAKQEIKIKAGTKVAIQAGTDLLCKSGTKTAVQAGTDLTCKAGMNLNAQANMNMTCKANMNFKAQANLAVDIKSSLKLAMEGLTTDVKGTVMLNAQAAAMAKVAGAVLNLQGAGMINNTAAMIRLGGLVKIG